MGCGSYQAISDYAARYRLVSSLSGRPRLFFSFWFFFFLFFPPKLHDEMTQMELLRTNYRYIIGRGFTRIDFREPSSFVIPSAPVRFAGMGKPG